MQIVIDTNIWINSQKWGSTMLSCCNFLSNFMQNTNDELAVDDAHIMMQEYEDNLKESPFFRTCIQELYKQNRIAYGSGELTNKHKKGLDQVGFHEPEDRVFLARAFNGDKYLVTEDSDYGCSPDSEKNDELALSKKQYIETQMGVTLADSQKASEEARGRLFEK